MGMKAAERKAAKYHCGPGDSYPIDNESDAHDAWNLAGHADNPTAVRACVRRVAAKEGWSLPKTADLKNSQDDQTWGDSAAITFEDEEYVVREGKVFQIGTHDSPDPTQRFEFTPQDAESAVAAFAPVQAELEHFFTNRSPSIFDGHLGRLERVWRAGEELHGQIRVPRWVDKVWGEAGRKLSLVFDPDSKQIIRCGLVLHPRVPDAVMMSEDHAAESAEGEVALATAYAEFAGRRHSGADLKDMQTVHDIAVQQGATCADAMPGTGRALFNEETDMGEKTEEQKGQTQAGSTGQVDPPPAIPVEFAAEHQRMKDELERLRAERRHEKAVAQVNAYITQKRKLLPAAFAQAVANLEMDYLDDETRPVLFAAQDGGTKRNRADSRLAEWDALPTQDLTEEGMPVHVLRFSDDNAEARKSNPFTPEGAEEAARQYAARRNGKG